MDTDLVVRAQDGDEIAFARLADGVYGGLQQLAYRILRDPELARDAAQQTALSMWRNLPQLRDPSCFDAWSYRLCFNACYKEARRRKHAIPVIGSGRIASRQRRTSISVSSTTTNPSAGSAVCRWTTGS